MLTSLLQLRKIFVSSLELSWDPQLRFMDVVKAATSLPFQDGL